ncbi:hypothetical protein [Amycolatopsis sp. NPDC051102]|uniref:hypothetical protein n=1 Tax=Amycolatopsis sp. NPDC051102 TaxID=3155163 RepID=UPI003431CEA0
MSAPVTMAPDWDSFAGSGLLHEVGGHRCVAGASTDPDGHVDCLVEHAPEPVVTDPAALRLLAGTVLAEHPGDRWRDLVVRVPGPVVPAPPLARDLSHLRCTGAFDATVRPPDGVRIAPSAGAGDEAHVRDWLRRAVVTGNGERELPQEDEVVDRIVDGYLTAPDRVSLVASVTTAQGRLPIAHATMLTAAVDDLIGTSFVDLVDILVEAGHDARALIGALSAACARHARALGRPLVGNVVHSRSDAANGERVVASLVRRGWELTDTYWRCSLEGLRGAR